jgi:hypothetical protein
MLNLTITYVLGLGRLKTSSSLAGLAMIPIRRTMSSERLNISSPFLAFAVAVTDSPFTASSPGSHEAFRAQLWLKNDYSGCRVRS